MKPDVWKWIAISAVSLTIGLLGGQFIPNRNIVVREDLTQAITQQQVTTAALVESNKDLSTRLLAVEVQLAAVNTKLALKP